MGGCLQVAVDDGLRGGVQEAHPLHNVPQHAAPARRGAIKSAKRRDRKREKTRSKARRDAIKSAKRRDQKRETTRSKT